MVLKPPPLPSRAQIPPPLPKRLGYAPPPLTPLDLPTLAALKSLPLRSRALLDAAGLGTQRTRRIGADVEFADYRDYQPGDDLKRIDWRLYARTDRLHVRRAHAETTLRLVLLLDVSLSMVFSGHKNRLTKIDYARMSLGALMLLARRQRDSCGAGLVGLELSRWIPAGTATSRYDSVWGLLESPPIGNGTHLPAALDQALSVVQRRSLFVLASDFYTEPASLQPAVQRLRAEGHEMIALRVLDPTEIDFPFQDAITFQDIETGRQLPSDPAAIARSYHQAFNAHAKSLDELFSSHGCDLCTFRTDTLPMGALRAYLERRRRRN